MATSGNASDLNNDKNFMEIYIGSKDQNVTQGQSYQSITATVPAGYTFLCWLQPASKGWVGNIYTENNKLSTTQLWCNGGFGGTQVYLTWLCYKK